MSSDICLRFPSLLALVTSTVVTVLLAVLKRHSQRNLKKGEFIWFMSRLTWQASVVAVASMAVGVRSGELTTWTTIVEGRERARNGISLVMFLNLPLVKHFLQQRHTSSTSADRAAAEDRVYTLNVTFLDYPIWVLFEVISGISSKVALNRPEGGSFFLLPSLPAAGRAVSME